MSKKMLTGAESALEKDVQRIVNGYAEEYEDGAQGFIEDLMQGGCQSGMVSELIYYTDTVKFFEKHLDEISALLSETVQEFGQDPSAIFGDKWDSDDPLAREDMNKNLLAWFAFEEIARRLAADNGIES